MLEAEWRPESLKVAAALVAHAERTGRQPAYLTQAWVMRNQLVTSTLGGPRTFDQWQGALDALDCPWSVEDEDFCDRLVSPGEGSSLGPSDPHHPVEGRLARTGVCQ